MEKHTYKFMKELWCLLLSAQRNISGIPQKFLDEKAEEARKKKVNDLRLRIVLAPEYLANGTDCFLLLLQEAERGILSEIGKRREQQAEVGWNCVTVFVQHCCHYMSCCWP